MKNINPTSLDEIPVVRVTVPLGETNLSLVDVLGFGGALKDMAVKTKGGGRVFRLASAVQIDLQGVTQDQIAPWMAAFGEFLIKNGTAITIATTTTTTAWSSVIPGEYLREKLTRKLLLSLPSGAFLLSNVSAATIHLTSHSDRERLWEQAINDGIDQRTVTVLWSASDASLFRNRRSR